MELSNFARNAKFSAIRKMFNLSQEVKDKISFAFGEPDFDTPQPIIDRACHEWNNHRTHYTMNKGIQELRDAVSEYHDRLKMTLPHDPNKNVCITNGGSDGIRVALATILDPGDEVIATTPCWSNYFGQAAMYGAKIVEVPSYEINGFRPAAEDIEKAITPKTKCIMINYPCNPTGAIMNEECAKDLAKIIDSHDIYLLADEVYSNLIYDGKKHVSVLDYVQDKEKCIYLNSFSKMFAMTGWRLAYVIANEKIIAAMNNVIECGPSCFPEPTQLAGVTALRECTDYIFKMKESYDRRRKLILELLKDVPLITCQEPEGAFYVFPNIKQLGVDDMDFCMDLLYKAGVVMIPGSGFGEAGRGYVRISYATSDENIREGIRRFKNYIEENYVR